jgi:hypothetical protein
MEHPSILTYWRDLVHWFLSVPLSSPQPAAWKDWVNLVGAVVSIGSAVFTVIGLRQSRELVASLSTKFEGDFPHYLPKVAEIIKKSNRRILILGNIPTHGAYTKRDAWLEVRLAIEAKITEQLNKKRLAPKGDFKAVIGYGDPKHRVENYELRYKKLRADPDGWEKYKKDNRDRIEDFLDLVPTDHTDPLPDYKDLTVDRLIKARNAYDEHIVETTFKPFSFFRGDEQFPLFLWIADDEAVFTFKTEDREGRYNGPGIYTRDGKLIETLVQTFESYERRYIVQHPRADRDRRVGDPAP